MPGLMSHTRAFWRARPQTCQCGRRISLSKGCESPLWCRQRQHHAAEPGNASGSVVFLGKRSHFGNALTCTELGWGGAPPVKRCGLGGEARLLLGCPKAGSVLVPQHQAKPVKPTHCAQGRGNSSARDTSWEPSCPQAPLLVPRGGGTVASGPLHSVP